MAWNLAMSISLGVLGALITLENLFVCFLVLRFKRLRSYTNGFVVSLAMADLLFGVVIIPLHLADERSLVTNYILALVLMTNITTLLSVTFDRYLAVLKPLDYSPFMKKQFLKIIIASWVVPTAFALLPLIWGTNTATPGHKVYIYCLVVFGILIPYILILSAYICIFRRVAQHVKYLAGLESLSQDKEAVKEGKRVTGEAYVARIFAVIAAVFVVSWMPVVYMTFVSNLDRPDLIPVELAIASWFTLSLGSLINAPIYAFMKRDFHDVLWTLFTRGRRGGSLPEQESDSPTARYSVTEQF